MPRAPGLLPLVGFPVPPQLAATLGYSGDARCVGFYWVGQKFLWDDGRRSATGADWHAWRAFTSHPRVARFLSPFYWYDDHEEAPDGFVLDQGSSIAYAGPLAAVREFLVKQYPPAGPQEPLVLDEAHWAALTARLIQAHAQFGAERADSDATRAIRLQALCDWLDGRSVGRS